MVTQNATFEKKIQLFLGFRVIFERLVFKKGGCGRPETGSIPTHFILIFQGPEGRKRSLGERSRTSPRILMLNGKKDDTKRGYNRSNSQDGESSADTETSSDSPASPGKVIRGAEKRRSQKSVKILESDITETDVEKIYEAATKNLNDKTIQERPLPELPPKL